MKMYGGQINRNKWVTAIVKNVAYNHWIADQVIHSQQAGRRALIVSDRVQHCKDLSDLIRKKGAEEGVPADVGLYIGDMKEDQLEASKKCSVVIATYAKMSEGTDIPELDTLFLATPRTDVEQVVGRIQRVVDGKKPLLIVDPVFTSQYNTRMANKRRQIYERLGFKKQEKK
jgi:superfamily II DNA or RNA helicase